MLSLAEENYLKTIYHLSESGRHDVSTNAISEMQKTKPASVSDMIKKLSIKGAITYQKYKGVNLSNKGKKIALQIIRKHRLWEVFLVEKLHFKWDEVHEIAEQLEHIKSPILVEKLDEFLGHPRIDPHGDPIPDENGEMAPSKKAPLKDIEIGKEVIVTGVENSESNFLAHLDKMKIALGSKLKVLERNSFDGSMQIKIKDQPPIFISLQVADNLWVTE
ncbi:MAG: metal-dependent transcriptional regulator [Reichenbachiella sp.]